jgi:hypothetical protein
MKLNMSQLGPLSCAECGFHLVIDGIAGSLAYCGQCANYVITKIEQRSPDAVGRVIAVVAGVAVAAVVVGILGAIFGSKE